MTREELERIKQAYNSGLKVQIWFNGHWENFDIRDYSMYSEPFSENRQYRIVGSAYADMAEKRIAELEKENAKLKSRIEELDCQFLSRNEWHYVKDGLPEELHDVLCFVIHNEHRYVLQGYLREGRWVLSPLGTYLNNDDVIAWKEIVLPEEIKEKCQ